MEWLIWISVAALAIGIWHELHRFPAANESFHKIQKRVDELEMENEDLKRRLNSLEDEAESISVQLDRIRNPALWHAFDENDGFMIHDLEKDKKEK